jgi:hypothetical protein
VIVRNALYAPDDTLVPFSSGAPNNGAIMPTKKKSKPKNPKQHSHITGRFNLDKRADLLAVAPEAAGSDDELLTTRETSEWLRVSPDWLAIGRGKNYGPKFEVLGPSLIRYRRGTVRAWLAEREVAHTKRLIGG